MELIKNVFFNTDKLTPNIDLKISYTGKFFQDDSKSVTLHYGFGEKWENLTDLEMKKTELGFQAELKLIDSDSFNFCFKNEKDEWDNNNCNNFIFNIEHPEISLATPAGAEELLPVVHLRKSYLLKKKVRIAMYKAMHYLPKLIKLNYKRKDSLEN